MEIQRLIGRSLRAMVDLTLLGERTHYPRLRCHSGGRRHAPQRSAVQRIACDAIQTLDKGLIKQKIVKIWLQRCQSGIVDQQQLCDLEYVEDSNAETDMNVVMTDDSRMIEVQGTARKVNRSATMNYWLYSILTKRGIAQINQAQKAALETNNAIKEKICNSINNNLLNSRLAVMC